uniref:Uncharacterized protein n=1 Tax=Arundo donax TaxID=35708 RepID=A0A0A9C232_ARUDO
MENSSVLKQKNPIVPREKSIVEVKKKDAGEHR